MNIEAISSAAQWQYGQQSAQGNQPSFSNTAQLLGLSNSTVSTDLHSGKTLAGLAQQKGVSSSDLLASVEQDLQANAPQGAPTLSSDQLGQIATNVINGTPPTPPNVPGSSGDQGGTSGTGGPPALSLSNTAQLLGVSSSDLSTDVHSGKTLAGLAQQKGVSSSDLLASVEKDLQANAPQGAPQPVLRPARSDRHQHHQRYAALQHKRHRQWQPQLTRDCHRRQPQHPAPATLLRPRPHPTARLPQPDQLRLGHRRLPHRRRRRRRVRLTPPPEPASATRPVLTANRNLQRLGATPRSPANCRSRRKRGHHRAVTHSYFPRK